jgi:hypothetical protein
MTAITWILLGAGVVMVCGLIAIMWHVWRAPVGEETPEGFKERESTKSISFVQAPQACGESCDTGQKSRREDKKYSFSLPVRARPRSSVVESVFWHEN